MAPEQVPSVETHTERAFDVAVVGASLAGCTAAVLYAMQGLRVALVEQHRDPGSFKHLCTHFIQASAVPTLTRFGLDRLIEESGGIRNAVDVWTPWGWTGDAPPEDFAGNRLFGYNIRRSTLDPILRKVAAGTSGVTVFPGCSVRSLIEDRGAAPGIEISGACPTTLRAKLIVAADGRNSRCAHLGGVPAKSSPNCRAIVWREYREVPLRRGECSQMWFHGDAAASIFPNDDGVTVAVYMPHEDTLAPFHADAGAALQASFAALPDAPDLARAQPLAAPFFVKDYPNLWRPAVARGMALVGDALMSIDPLWGIGCGFAFQTAQWLVDCTAPEMLAGKVPTRGLRRYARAVVLRLSTHRFLVNDFSRRRRFNFMERLMFSAAAKDRRMSRHLHTFGARLISPFEFLSPVALARAAWVNATHAGGATNRVRSPPLRS